MTKCLSCYKELNPGERQYHKKCSLEFFGTESAPELPYNFSELEHLATEALKQSITVPGVQPKLSLGWLNESSNTRLTLMDALDGNYILKPQNPTYPQMPENEHLSMKLAQLFHLDIVPVNLIPLASGELCFITRRIDRNEDGSRNHMIDFHQILESEDKYKGTMEGLGAKIGELSEHTMLDKLKFFEAAVFNYVIGNNDMHLKNFSMFKSDLGWVLSPFYDLLNVKLLLPTDPEDSALLLGGKKLNFTKVYFDRFAKGLGLNPKQTSSVYKRLSPWLIQANQLIDHSFLNTETQINYKTMIEQRSLIFKQTL